MTQHCIFCKSTTHTYRNCPLAFRMKRARLAKREYTGEAPNVFVGQYGYPKVNVGLLSVEEYTEQDEPRKWSAEGKGIPEIVELRSQLVNSTFQSNVRQLDERLLRLGQEIGMAARPAELEVTLAKRPVLTPTFHREAQPHGPTVKLERARLTGNVKVDSRVEKVVDDHDLKSTPALIKLYGQGFDEQYLRKLFSTGNLGVKTERKLVPTRWSITAVDDTLGKALIEKIRDFREGDCRLYTGGYLGNEYVILCFDEPWSYELFEGYVPSIRKGGLWETDFEGPLGRKAYAKETVGGYYAARLAILEGLQHGKRQAAVLALRFITEAYSTPLGVWVVREAVRKAMSKPLVFADRRLLVRLCEQRFGIDIRSVFERSRLRKQRRQTRLGKWV